MALKDACRGGTDFNYNEVLPQLEKELEDFILSIGGKLLDINGAPQSDEITVYFTNNKNWANVNVYLWSDGGSSNASWPGVPMTYVKTNNMGEKIYSVTFKFSDYNKIIFNNGSGQQTVDIVLSGENNVGYYISGGSGNSLTCDTYIFA